MMRPALRMGFDKLSLSGFGWLVLSQVPLSLSLSKASRQGQPQGTTT